MSKESDETVAHEARTRARRHLAFGSYETVAEMRRDYFRSRDRAAVRAIDEEVRRFQATEENARGRAKRGERTGTPISMGEAITFMSELSWSSVIAIGLLLAVVGAALCVAPLVLGEMFKDSLEFYRGLL